MILYTKKVVLYTIFDKYIFFKYFFYHFHNYFKKQIDIFDLNR
jgi:hypothetical protein